MTDINQFLRERLDDEEAVAKKAATQTSQSGNRGPGEWWVKDGEPDSRYSSSVGGCRVYTNGDQGSNLLYSLASVQHIADHDPARILREVAAKRAILKSAELWSNAAFPDFDGGYACAMDDAVMILASAYSDHPGFDPKWSLDD